MTDITKWRSMNGEDRDKFISWTECSLYSRMDLGREKYQSDIKGFQGNPLDHLIEELLDALLYAYWEKRRQSEEG